MKNIDLFFRLIDKNAKGVWRYAKLYSPFIAEEDRCTLGEGGVRCQELGHTDDKRLAGRRIIFKREDENPAGSHKARAASYQISYYKSMGYNTLLVSSSGNAAIAAAEYCNLCGMKLIAFVDKNTPAAKLGRLIKTGQSVLLCEKPINFAKYAARIFTLPNLRPSTDDMSIEPYKSIAFEIFEEFGDGIDAVFMFPTSASSLIGTARGFLKLKDEFGAMKAIPKIIAVQTGIITSIAEQFAPADASHEEGIAGALGVRATKRTGEAVKLIRETGGTGVIVTSEEIKMANDILEKNGIITSEEGAAAFAGAISLTQFKNVICILSGQKHRRLVDVKRDNVFHTDSYTEVRNIVGKIIK